MNSKNTPLKLISVDNGNRSPHVGIFSQEKNLELYNLDEFAKIQNSINYSEYNILISDVGQSHPILRKLSTIALNLSAYRKPNQFFDMPLNYADSLGEDRLYESFFIYKKYIKRQHIKNSLLIDAGTFITLDIIDEQGLRGGYIYPGLQVFLESYQAGAHLPKIDTKDLPHYLNRDLPHTTEQAIMGGAMRNYLALFEHMIKTHGPFEQIILTGGSHEKIAYLLSQIPGVVFKLFPHLIHYALYFINQNLQETQ